MSSPGASDWARRMLDAWSRAGHPGPPVDPRALALDVVAGMFPAEPITRVEEFDVPGIEGALLPLARGKGWAIAYARRGRPAGRANFTIAHELGHFLMHRALLPDGIRSGPGAVDGMDSNEIEREANAFAVSLLMPLGYFRGQASAFDALDRDGIASCARRYGVSVTAALLRWLHCTDRAALVVYSRNGFVSWARSSRAALRRGWFLSSAGRPVEIPSGSPALPSQAVIPTASGQACRWFGEPARELAFRSGRGDHTTSLVLFDVAGGLSP